MGRCRGSLGQRALRSLVSSAASRFLVAEGSGKALSSERLRPRCVSSLPAAGRLPLRRGHRPSLSFPQPCWFTASSETRPNVPPKSCTGCCMSSPSSSPWWVSSWAQPSPPPLASSPLPLPGIPGRDTGCWDKSPEVPASQVSLGSPPACPHVSSHLWSRPGGGVRLPQEEGLS